MLTSHVRRNMCALLLNKNCIYNYRVVSFVFFSLSVNKKKTSLFFSRRFGPVWRLVLQVFLLIMSLQQEPDMKLEYYERLPVTNALKKLDIVSSPT